MSDREFTLMVKPVGARCNMRCRYCYYIGKGEMSSADIMSERTLERLIRQCVAAAQGNGISIVWHGGEPTLAGLSFFKRAVKLQKRYSPSGFAFVNNLQTNGLLLDDDWLDFIARNDFDLGISVDGSEFVHDKYRKNVAGEGTFSRVSYVINMALQKGIHADLLCTVNSETVKRPKEVFDALCGFSAGWMQFIPVVAPKGAAMPEAVSGAEYGEFLKAVFDIWITRELGRNDVQLFSELANVINGGESKVCYLKPTCGDVPVIEADGSVFACDHFVDIPYRLGSIYNDPLKSLIKADKLLDFGARKNDLPNECLKCAYLRFCHGGCLKDRYDKEADSEKNRSVLCNGLKAFFEYSLPMFESLIRMNKNGLSNEAMMKRMSEKIKNK